MKGCEVLCFTVEGKQFGQAWFALDKSLLSISDHLHVHRDVFYEDSFCGFTNMYKYLMGGSKGDGARFFSVMFTDSIRDNRQKLKYRKCPLSIDNTPLLLGRVGVVQTLEQIIQTDCGISILGDIENLTGHSSEQPAVGDCFKQGCWARPSSALSSSHSHSIISLKQLFTQAQPVCILFLGSLLETEACETLWWWLRQRSHWLSQTNLCSLSLNQTCCSAPPPWFFSY